MDDTTAITNVTFTPCARTYWHTHEEGQFLKVVAGLGRRARRINVGDLIWAPPGTTHWHGADEGGTITHFVIALGKTTWHDAVTDEQYGVKKG
ncbi:RmlC-like cupin domain-containing protein [Penicillium canescens]|uniref:RmlC-like cupin domain-containing protein n=1 Tax=Penicillium canescens TaxID=5083 RepID=A0AAD6IMY0_PENCN|nr:RmlC-like cupin domain-containing protein [Penicillium canescens]